MIEIRARGSGAKMSQQGQSILIAMLIAVLILILWSVLLGGMAIFIGQEAVVCYSIWNFRGFIGIPSAIIAAVTIVTLLAAGIGGNFKMSLWGLSLEGPSAPITMWVVCFLCITLALYMLIPEVKTFEGLPPLLAKFCKAG